MTFSIRDRVMRVVAALALVVGFHAVSTQAQPAAEEGEAPPEEAASMGIIAPILLYGTENNTSWIGETDGNGYRLINPDDPQAIKYFYVNPEPGQEGKRTVAVSTVVLQGDGSIGLLYGFQEDPKSYYLLLLDGNRTVTAYHRPPEGGLVKQFHAELSSNNSNGGPMMVTLKIVEEGDTATIWFDDRRVTTLEGPGVGQGGVGIGALGRVDGLFLDFQLTTAE
ncbi:MAG: hypothetical protein AAF593_16855 [Planctomycetota bacterium]